MDVAAAAATEKIGETKPHLSNFLAYWTGYLKIFRRCRDSIKLTRVLDKNTLEPEGLALQQPRAAPWV